MLPANNPSQSITPGLLRLLCVMGFIGALTAPFTMHKPPWTTQLGVWFWPYLVPHILLQMAALIGLWKMKRWGLMLYALSILEGLVFLQITGHLSVVGLVLFGILFSIPFYYRRAMS